METFRMTVRQALRMKELETGSHRPSGETQEAIAETVKGMTDAGGTNIRTSSLSTMEPSAFPSCPFASR